LPLLLHSRARRDETPARRPGSPGSRTRSARPGRWPTP